MRSLRFTVSQLLGSHTACGPSTLQAALRGKTLRHGLKGICQLQPSGSIHAHILQKRINESIPPNSTELYLLLLLLLHLLSDSNALHSPTLLWLAGPFTLSVFMLRDALFIQVFHLRRNRESLDAGKPQAVFTCILHLTVCSAVQQRPSNKQQANLRWPKVEADEKQKTSAFTSFPKLVLVLIFRLFPQVQPHCFGAAVTQHRDVSHELLCGYK